MDHIETPHAGIFLTHDIALNDRQLLSDAAQVLRRLDSASGRAIRRSKKRAALMADHFGVAVRVQRIPNDAPYLSVRILHRKDERGDDTLARRILAQTVRGMLSHIPVETIDWYDCETLIEPDDFREMFDPQVAESVYSPSQPPHMDFALSEHLRDMMELDDAPEPVEPQPAAVVAPVVERRQAPERASTRSPSKRRKLGLGVVLVPLRAPRLLWSLWRRMDLRIIAQVTAVVALLVALQNTEFLRDILYQVMR
ncbi:MULTISPECIES: hypothetical protein [Salipiger]|uniref:hypothetical protein n=1 Tax=Salipiger TaxID=263377 RepID=UPI0035137771